MLKHPTLDQLNQLGLTRMAHAFADLDGNGDTAGLQRCQARSTCYRTSSRQSPRLAQAPGAIRGTGWEPRRLVSPPLTSSRRATIGSRSGPAPDWTD